MNPISAEPPPPPAQPPRSSFSCDRHPAEQFTGFCPCCLCERLTSLDDSSSNTPSSSRRPSSASAAAAAAIRSLFSSNSKISYFSHHPLPPPPKAPKPSTFASHLRRAKSFSASKNESLGLAFEPQRKSCDVRAKSNLWPLFTVDVENKNVRQGIEIPRNPEIEADVVAPELDDDSDGGGDEISETRLGNSTSAVELEGDAAEIVEDKVLNPMKDHIDREKKNSGGGIWAAASVFSKKFRKWRQKQKAKKQNKHPTLPVEKSISRQRRETQSEIADYGFGRRSCDTDPRFSLDAGRISTDDPRFSFEDPPRASCDGHLIGRRSFSRMTPMVSVMEDVPQTQSPRPDMLIPVEQAPPSRPISVNEAETVPGGSAQTREYYTRSSRRRKSLDRSSSLRKTAATMAAGIDDELPNPNCFHSNSQRDACSETFELANGFRDSRSSQSRSGEEKEPKKSGGWSWRLWGFIHRRNVGAKEEEDDEFEKCSRANALDRSYSGSWHDPKIGRRYNRNSLRSNSNVSWRNGSQILMEKNQPSRLENGLLRFYLTPLKNSSRGGTVKMNPANYNTPHSSVARSVLRLY